MNGKRSDESLNSVVPEDDARLATMLGHLHGLLQRQLALMRQGRLAAAVALFDETDQCVREIAMAQGRGTARAREQASATSRDAWLGIERLFHDLSVALTAQQTEVSAALDAIGRGKKVLKAYRGYLPST